MCRQSFSRIRYFNDKNKFVSVKVEEKHQILQYMEEELIEEVKDDEPELTGHICMCCVERITT